MKEVIEILIGLICLFFIVFLISIYNKLKKNKKIRKKIVENYGKKIDIDEVDLKFEGISSYHKNKVNYYTKYKDYSIIDDITWNDLNMNDVFKKINNTQSSAGEEVLYDILRSPIHNEEILNKREALISYFTNNPDDRFNIQYILSKLGYSKDLYTSNCLFNNEYDNNSKLLKYQLLGKLPFASLILIIFNPYFILLTIGLISLNIYISIKEGRKNYNTEGFTYLIKVCNTARKIKNLNIKYIEENLNNINEDLNKIRRIRRKNIGTDPNSLVSELNVFSEYTNMLFLSEIINYEKVKKNISKNKEYFKNIFEYVGTIDALIGAASFRESLDYFTIPKLTRTKKYMEFEKMYHPLIQNPVTNSGSFKKSVLITGSNASGKSTFIKSVAINAILSQSINTCCAKDYNGSYFNIYTSMALKDDVLSNESYYIVEIKSLKRILDSIYSTIPTLCVVDEILRGTNTVERIASSSEVLSSLSENNCICFAATHDIELTYLLEDKFDNYHFQEDITDKEIKFDYKLYNGRTQSRNAIKLLGFIGYSDYIVNKAKERAEKFLSTGEW